QQVRQEVGTEYHDPLSAGPLRRPYPVQLTEVAELPLYHLAEVAHADLGEQAGPDGDAQRVLLRRRLVPAPEEVAADRLPGPRLGEEGSPADEGTPLGDRLLAVRDAVAEGDLAVQPGRDAGPELLLRRLDHLSRPLLLLQADEDVPVG